MKINFFTSNPNSPASLFYLAGLKQLQNISIMSQEWQSFDVALIMGFPSDFAFIRKAKECNPNIKIGVLDPRGRVIEEVLHYIDFFIVDSLEMIDFFAGYGKPICQYYEYYPVSPQMKTHQEKSEITVGYHGNKVHLMSMWPVITESLIALAKTKKVSFKAIYNIEKLGNWELGCPAGVTVEHTQLDDKTYEKEISSCDIGIVPALSPTPNYGEGFLDRKIYLLDQDDYIMRFKMPSNAGRIIVFALKGIPVVADMIPSSCQMINHGENGFLAYSAGGWYDSLLRLALSADLRNNFSSKLYQNVLSKVDYEIQNAKLLNFLGTMSDSVNQYPTFKRSFRSSHPDLKLNYLKKKILGGLGTPV